MIRVTDILHFIGGVIAAQLAVVEPMLTLVLTLLFVVYEYMEYMVKRDMAYRDILEFMLGVYTGSMGVVACKLAAWLLGLG